jgi:Kunitz/Bovine pancreatic trypsin inhibitor domain
MMSQKNKGSGSRAGRVVVHVLLAAAWLSACGGLAGKPAVGGESHFLRHCTTTCGGGLTCVSSVCTRGCVRDTDRCDDLAPQAACTDQSIEPGQVAVCDLGCESDNDCSALGAAYACESGFCRGAALPGNEPPSSAGSGGTSVSSAGGGGGGAGGSSAGAPSAGGTASGGDPGYVPPSCDYNGDASDCPVGFECVKSPTQEVGACVEAAMNTDCSTDVNGDCPVGQVCGTGPEGPRCFPVAVDCVAPWTCEAAEPAECPYGFGRARTRVENGVASCFGACVPLPSCACGADQDCPSNSRCDAATNGCVALPWQPPELCSLPFDAGSCDANFPVFTFQGGGCVETRYGGCGGNANRFGTLDECLGTCAGVPLPNACPGGEASRRICVSCGLAGGCGQYIDACPRPCDGAEDCVGAGLTCDSDGFCGAGSCI